MEQFSHDLTLALEETSRTNSNKVRWGVRRRTRSTGNLPCAPQPTEDSSSSPTDPPPSNNVVMNQADSPCLSGSNNLVQSDSDDRHSVAFAFKLRQTPLSGNFESDSLNENFSPARPNMRRKRKYKRMAVEYETTPSTPHIGGAGSALFPVAGTVKKRVFKHSCPDNFRSAMLFCGKRKRGQRDRSGMDYDFCKQHSSSVPRQRGVAEFFGLKGPSYSEYRSRNRAASFSASLMKCERILPLTKTVVSKIERISADRDRERSTILGQSVIPPGPSVTGSEFNFSIPMQQHKFLDTPGNPSQAAVVVAMGGPIIGPPSGEQVVGGQHQKQQEGPLVLPSPFVPLVVSQPTTVASLVATTVPSLVPDDSVNPQQLTGVSKPISVPLLGAFGVPVSAATPVIPVQQPSIDRTTEIAKAIDLQPAFEAKQHPFRTSQGMLQLTAKSKVLTATEPMAATGSSYPKEKHRHRKSKYNRKKQILMMSGPEGHGQLMDCGGQVNDFLSSSSLSSSDSEAVLANETDHEGDDELTDWPGNEAMITFASKHDFRKAYHSTGQRGLSIASGRPFLPQISQQDDLADDDTLMSADEMLSAANVPPTGTLSGGGLGGLGGLAGATLPIAIGATVQGVDPHFLVNNVGTPTLANEIREIRAGCRRIREERPGFSIISSVNELLSRFLQDDQQRELTLHDVNEAEHDKLQNLCKLYSLNARQLADSVLVLSKTSNTMQSVRIDQSNLPKRLGDFKRRCYGASAEPLQFHDGGTS
ncbi:uncharacterized protein LOC128274227 isoform X2 [Anopheles cruzii]|uniref:uncharacterized protein LOC128274227 isoform X2 n=1 Tax=Anopheles cruzii TaxID=68878 RepID=UPI0022EC2315|nr:uncharacterized protein LOC128274227 isoform X2 [Anopheles cruzii]